MEASYHRHDISENVWALLEPHLPGQRGQWGGIAQDNRRFIDAVFWGLRTGAPWRDLPPDYGKWGSVHQRFIRWRRKGVWKKLLVHSWRLDLPEDTPPGIPQSTAPQVCNPLRQNLRGTFFQFPYVSGKSRQGAPVLRIQNTPLINCRVSRAFPPRQWCMA